MSIADPDYCGPPYYQHMDSTPEGSTKNIFEREPPISYFLLQNRGGGGFRGHITWRGVDGKLSPIPGMDIHAPSNFRYERCSTLNPT